MSTSKQRPLSIPQPIWEALVLPRAPHEGLCLSPNSNPMRFDEKEVPRDATGIRVVVEVANETVDNGGDCLGTVSNLEGDDPSVLRRGKLHQVGKVAVERKTGGIALLRLLKGGTA